MDSPTFLPTLEAAAARGRVRHYPMLLYVASLSVLRRRSQVVRQRSAKPPFVGSIPTGASLSHKNLGPPRRRPFRLWRKNAAGEAPIQITIITEPG